MMLRLGKAEDKDCGRLHTIEGVGHGSFYIPNSDKQK